MNIFKKWDKTFEVKDLLSDDVSEKEIKRISDIIIKRLKTRRPFDEFENYTIISEFENSLDSGNVNDFNDAMDFMYDIADDGKQVWIK